MAITGATITKDITPAGEAIVANRAALPAAARVGEIFWVASEKSAVMCTDDGVMTGTTGAVVWSSFGGSVISTSRAGETPAASGLTTIPTSPTPGTIFINTTDGAAWIYGPDPTTAGASKWMPIQGGGGDEGVTIVNGTGMNPAQNPPGTAPVAGDIYINRNDGTAWIYAALVPPANLPGWEPLTPQTANVFASDIKGDTPTANTHGTIPVGITVEVGDRFVNRLDHKSWVYGPNPSPQNHPLATGGWIMGATSPPATGEIHQTAQGIAVNIHDGTGTYDATTALLAYKAGDVIRIEQDGQPGNYWEMTMTGPPTLAGGVVTLPGPTHGVGAAPSNAGGLAVHMHLIFDVALPSAHIWLDLPTQNTALMTDQIGETPDKSPILAANPASIGDIFVNRADGVSWALAEDPGVTTNDHTQTVFGGPVAPPAITDLTTLRAHGTYGDAAQIAAGRAAFGPGWYVMVGTSAFTWNGLSWQNLGHAPNANVWGRLGSVSATTRTDTPGVLPTTYTPALRPAKGDIFINVHDGRSWIATENPTSKTIEWEPLGNSAWEIVHHAHGGHDAHAADPNVPENLRSQVIALDWTMYEAFRISWSTNGAMKVMVDNAEVWKGVQTAAATGSIVFDQTWPRSTEHTLVQTSFNHGIIEYRSRSKAQSMHMIVDATTDRIVVDAMSESPPPTSFEFHPDQTANIDAWIIVEGLRK